MGDDNVYRNGVLIGNPTPSVRPIPFAWVGLGEGTYRAKVFGGWIVEHYATADHTSMVFIPDPHHQWRLKEDEE